MLLFQAMFCSLDCQEASAESHVTECRVMLTLVNLELGQMSYNLVKILCKTGFDQLATFLQTRGTGQQPQLSDKRTAGFTDGKYDPTDFNTIFNLQQHTHPVFFTETVVSIVTSACLVKILGDVLPDPYEFGGLILHLFCCLSFNGSELREVYKGHRFPPDAEHDVATGVGIHPTYCLVNHSCDPNLGRDYFGFDVVLRAIQPIKKGTEVTIAYHYRFTYFEKPQRQFLLSLKNGFCCKCEACLGDWPLADDMPLYPELATPEETRAYKLAASQLEPLHEQVLRDQIITPTIVFKFSKHLALLTSIPGGRLCENFNRCQQVLEQYWARLGNYYVDPYM